MTEAQAYHILGWKPEGGAPNPLVLPLANQGGNWFITECRACAMKGVCREESLKEGCGVCHKPFSFIFG